MSIRASRGALVVAGLAVWGVVLAAEDAVRAGVNAGSARLRPAPAAGEPPPCLHRRPRSAAAADPAPAARTTIGGVPLILYDLDGNGSFTDEGADAWRVDDDELRYAFPLEPTIVLDGRRTRIASASSEIDLAYEQDESAWPELPVGKGRDARAAQREILKALGLWNRLRMRNGLMPVHLDAALTGACMEHASYMQRWGVTHEQDPERDGATPEGDRVARSGSVGSLAASEEIVEVYATFYHRISLFHPDTRGAGIGTAGSRSIFNGTEGREPRPWTWPVVIPAPDTADVPRTYHSELPLMHEELRTDGTFSEPGFPITLTFERDDVKTVDALLREGGAGGDAVPFELSWPERPASSFAPNNYKSICLLPHASLRPRTTYWVHVEWTYRGELGQKTWTFRTGR